MSSIILDEKKKYEKIYTDLMFATNDLKQILDEEEIRKRVFIKKVDELSNYMAFLEDLEMKNKNEGKNIFLRIFKNQNQIDEKIKSYLTKDKKDSIKKLEKCKKCKCINCIEKCKFKRCVNCKELEYTYECDKEKFVFTKSSDIVTLYSRDEKFEFEVKGYLIELNDNLLRRYVYLVDIKNNDNQQLLEYLKFKGEENYESVIIGDNTENLDRLYDKFIEMGLNV